MLLRSGVLLVAFCLATTADAQERRLALVIGNDAYAELPTLKKAVNDARAVGDTLAAIGFRVLRGENLNRRAANRLLSDFEAADPTGRSGR
jgi:uncharacterized caspase-like protein